MRLVTFQPKSVLSVLYSNGIYIANSVYDVIGERVFCLKVDENLMENIYMVSPSVPQVAIEFEADAEAIDYVGWVNYLNGHAKTYVDSKCGYNEYVVHEIRVDQVKRVIEISNSDDIDTVWNDFLDYKFEDYEKLSGYHWTRDTRGKESAVMAIMDVMQPALPITAQYVNHVHMVVRESFRLSRIVLY